MENARARQEDQSMQCYKEQLSDCDWLWLTHRTHQCSTPHNTKEERLQALCDFVSAGQPL
ncbi:hypothetical protein E2C01_009310 [Portunus trituberculatus]|uniref:Uncharacterized protein n=1 Tax=Portunus trituberculatus TaxID=210409 RepID=A0A5B7D4Y0_PORTR|nr:hypothetical protein [Portunus trituberculatus]